ncbi:MAG TPA: hypothetical protein VGQ07_02315, partial [Nitrospirales bacterium]|nr:hypothetical protein [Nitrospirales bacterium]
MPLQPATLQSIVRIFNALDYRALGAIYCHEGGDAFWEERREPCQKLGIHLAEVLRDRLRPNGRSLYVGAGVAELPMLTMETMELQRTVEAYNLRTDEVTLLNAACRGLPFEFQAKDAREARGTFDHLWIVSVLNDPECFPELGALSSGRANPVMFDPAAFTIERQAVLTLAAGCLEKVARSGLVTTSVEEIPWITDWCERQGLACAVEDDDYPTAIVADPTCFIRIGEN